MNQREIFLRHVAQTSGTPLLGIDVNITDAKGCVLTDVNGKKYFDLISGISVSSIGHCHPAVVQAIQEQSVKFMHLMVFGEFNQSPQAEYAQFLSGFLPGNLNTVYFTTGGSEAVEGAMKLAKRVTGRPEIISFKKSYHGSTQGSLSLMGDEFFKNSFRPLLPGIKILDYNNISDLEQISSSTAAVFIEPVQGEAGVRKADKEFLTVLRKRCDELGVLLVFDEIQTGFGRTGKMFAFQHFDVVPDVLLVAKAMGGGLPIGAFISSQEILSAFIDDPVLGHINTFGGNAVCVKAAHATLKVLSENNLPARAPDIERIVKENLKHRLIREIRMTGALGAIEFGDEDLAMRAMKVCIEHGVITDWFLFCPTALRIAPPLVITDDELKRAMTNIIEALNSLA